MNQGRQGELGLGILGNFDDDNQDNVNNPRNPNNQGVPPVVPAKLVRDVAVPLTANLASSIRKPPLGGGLPGDTEPNPKQLHAVSTRSGLQLEELAPKKRDIEVSNEEKKVEEVVKSSNVEVAWVWLKIVCSVLLPAKHLTEVTRDKVVLVYMLMKEMPINVGAILRQNMMKFRNNLRWRFCYGGLITRFLRAEGIEEKTVDMTVAYHLDLTGQLVDVTRTKALDMSHGHVLFAQERQARDDSVMARMFGMTELQLRICGRPVTDAEMETMAERYPLTESAVFLCRTGPAFLEPLDDDEATADEAMDDEEDDVVDEEANALMVFNHGDDEA
uniref:Putative plant transposon protein domain-containing protein n=1 Tax=Solanum tuberosum TaxID=4113 RepID=M1DG69_SOLTU